MKGTIELTGMKFHSPIGCLESEKANGNDMVVDFAYECDITEPYRTDCIDDAVDYSDIYNIIAGEMAVPANLIENVAGRIVDAVAKAHPELESFTVKVSKKNPPLDGEVGWSSITVRK